MLADAELQAEDQAPEEESRPRKVFIDLYQVREWKADAFFVQNSEQILPTRRRWVRHDSLRSPQQSLQGVDAKLSERRVELLPIGFWDSHGRLPEPSLQVLPDFSKLKWSPVAEDLLIDASVQYYGSEQWREP